MVTIKYTIFNIYILTNALQCLCLFVFLIKSYPITFKHPTKLFDYSVSEHFLKTTFFFFLNKEQNLQILFHSSYAKAAKFSEIFITGQML